jgi:hypothetical protein
LWFGNGIQRQGKGGVDKAALDGMINRQLGPDSMQKN